MDAVYPDACCCLRSRYRFEDEDKMADLGRVLKSTLHVRVQQLTLRLLGAKEMVILFLSGIF